MKENSSQKGIEERGSAPSKSRKMVVFLCLGVVLLLVSLLLFWPAPAPVGNTTNPISEPTTERESERTSAAPPAADSIVKLASATAPLTAKPVQYVKKVVIDKSWNSEPDALGRFIPTRDGENEGAIIGPMAVTCIGDSIYVFDNNDPKQRRLAVYNADGGLISSIPMPGGLTWADLVVNPSDSSLFVIDHALNSIYKVRGSEVSELGRVSLGHISLGMLFGYDESSSTLYVRDKEQNGDIPILINNQPVDLSGQNPKTLSPVWGDFDPENNHNILLNFKDGQNLSVAFERRVESVDEMTMDSQGRVWVLFTLEHDYRVRRLAVVDPVRKTAGVELLNIHFPFENIRRIAPIRNGVVIISGDDDNGVLRTYELSGAL